MLIIIAALIAQHISQTQGECYNKTIEDNVTEFHNELRWDLATKNMSAKYGDIPGSKSLFKLKYDCALAALAGALIPKDCSKQARDLSPLGVSSNFRKFRTIKEIKGDDIIEYYNVTVEEWATKNIVPLDSDVVYKDRSMEAFANRYDMTLEAEAQAVADTCQDIESGVATTSGQNAYVMSTVTLPLYDVLVETQKGGGHK
ncbi:unnamed protein product [Cylicocyclus nassatus]|uniref:SCP domain-containing protein n=1 Tax=Cylicocyclus nassatus TaxID=53992 RepID=A0AA36M259_CYLNA|nr:unnamed protein product [Cylicocyclus nassatus]